MALNAGDIAFTQYNADGTDNFAFVALVAIAAGEVIKFTDNGVFSSGALRSGEGIITWTAPAGGVAAGTVVTITTTPSASIGSVVETLDLNFSGTGDGIVAYQGSDSTPTFIAALNNEGAGVFQATAIDTNTSALPTGLTLGASAVAINEVDNARYTGPTTGTAAELRAALFNAANWSGDDTVNQTGPASFTVSGGPAPADVSIGDVTITEGDAGTQILAFTVTRSNTDGAFTVDFATADITATAGVDYVARTGTLSFAAGGAATETVEITINGDADVELDETFTVTLSNLVSTTGSANLADVEATGTIENDDVSPTADISIGDVTITEGDAGTSVLSFTVTRSNTDGAFTLDFATADSSATAGVDYVAQSGTLTFTAGGAATETVEITINGDADVELDETFTVTLSNLVSTVGTANLLDATGLGTIENDDVAPATGGFFISEYVEGSSNNKAVELFNNTGAALDLSDYFLGLISNGGTDVEQSVQLSGTLAADEAFVVANGSANAAILAVADLISSSVVNFNGDDHVILLRGAGTIAGGGEIVDLFGTPDTGAGFVDPGTQWANGGVDTQDSTLRRKAVIEEGDPNGFGADVSGLGNQWDGFASDTFDGLGAHTVTPAGAALTVAIDAASMSENGGTSTATVTRSGSTAGDLVVTLASSDTGEATVPATVTILDGDASASFSVTAVDDADADGSQLVTVTATAAGFADGADDIVVLDDEPVDFDLISEIQGGAFFSPILAADGVFSFNVASITGVNVEAIVTAIDSDGFYLQEEMADWDANAFSSEGIFVQTTSLAGLDIGERVQVSAKVTEVQTFDNLPRTFLTNVTSITQSDVILSLPVLTITSMPNGILSDEVPDLTDAFDDVGDTFDPENDALDFYETIEGMLVTFPNMVVADGNVDGSNDEVRFKAYSANHADADQVAARGGNVINGDPASGLYDTAATDDDVIFGGRHLHDGDTNPEIVELDFSGAGIGGTTSFHNLLDMGDELGDVTGVIDFDFTEVKLFVTEALDPTRVAALGTTTPVQETTSLGGDDRALTFATVNALNLAGNSDQSRFDGLADMIAQNLAAPDIIAVQEIQDDNGASSGGTSAATTWQRLVDAVNLATGKVYQWVDEEPANNAEGGQPNGNIRVGFLYDTGRVQLGDLAADATIADRRAYVDRIGDGVRTGGDLLAFTDADVSGEISTIDWSNTRKSLLGEFNFNGNTIYATASHLPSKGGSGDFWQLNQNIGAGEPANSDWAQRNEIAEDLWSVMDFISGADADARIISGGDFNEFYFYRPMEVLNGTVDADGLDRVGGARFTNLVVSELTPNDRYTFLFDGRAQALDHVFADAALSVVAQLDAVHLNTGYNDRTGATDPSVTDHDPLLAQFDFRSFGESLAGGVADDLFDGFGGDDTLTGAAGMDTIDGGAGDDLLGGGDGDDVLLGGAGADRLFGAAGIDEASYAAFATGVTVSLLSNTANDGDTLSGIENLRGGAGDDSLTGSSIGNALSGGDGNDSLIGNAGNDTLIGGNGNDLQGGGNGDDRLFGAAGLDQLFGAAGNDSLTGGVDDDTLSGGIGRDVFRFVTALDDAGVDRITDFDVADDLIALENAFFGGLPAGALSPAALHLGASAGAADDRVIYDAATGALFFDADGSGVNAAVQFATLNVGLGLTAADFWVI